MKSRNFYWFLFGLGSELQIVASLSFTELFAVLVMPFIIFSEWRYMRRNGILTFFRLSVLVLIGCIVACYFNHTDYAFAIRGIAVTTIIPCAIVTSHWMLRKDPAGFKWMIVGCVISSFLCTFVFQKSVEVMMAVGFGGSASADDIMGGAVYWKNRLAGLISAPIKGWYIHLPVSVSFSVPLIIAVFSLLITSSGRGTALCALVSALMVLIGGRKSSSMRRICRHFMLFVVLGVLVVLAYKGFYTYAAPRGILGEESRKKFEMQTKGDASFAKLLMGGRMDSFCGLLAALDKPIIGWGPWAMDEGGYVEEFLSKYGTSEDYQNYIRSVHYSTPGFTLLKCHSHITMFWVWYGIFGLIFWLYVLFVLLRYLKQDCWSVPQWFMWLACGIPAYVWNACFNPLNDRVVPIMFVVACLVARAVRKGVNALPFKMKEEIRR